MIRTPLVLVPCLAAVGIGGAMVLVAAGAVAAPLAEHPTYAPLVTHWRSQMDLFDVPGVAIAVVEDGTAWVETAGRRNAEGDPVTPETVFYIASITKTYVATLAAILAEEGALSLDEPVTTYLPRFDLAGDDEARITVRDLLAHRPGINSGEIVLLDAYTGEITEDRYYHWLARVTPTFETRYTNVHYTLVGRVIEAVTGMDWRDALGARLFAPAGLAHTTGYVSEMYGGGHGAVPLEREADAWRAVDQRKTDRTMHAAGGLATSLVDAVRYLELHLAGGRIGDERLFSPETAAELTREQSAHEPDGSLRIMTGFGLGWQRGTFNGTPFLAHGGGYAGTSAYIAVVPGARAAFAILINGGGFAGGWGSAVAVDMFEAITGTTGEWDPWERFGAQVTRIKTERAAEAEAAGDVAGTATTDGRASDGAAAAADGEATDGRGEAAGAGLELSRPIGLYTGAFRNPWLGTLHVSRADGRLVLHLGDMPVEYEPAGTDEVRIREVTDPPAPLTFLVDAHGRIDRVRLVDEDWGEMFFDR